MAGAAIRTGQLISDAERAGGRLPTACGSTSIRFRRFTGRSNFPRSSRARMAASTSSSATRRSRARTRWQPPTREHYPVWLQTIHEESHGNADLVAHFYRRAFNLLRPDGAFGLIATNTIAQGDTRSTGLRWIRHHDGTIFAARKRVKWPAAAAVVVSVVHVHKGALGGPFDLDGRSVDRITAFLFHAGGDDDPVPLPENEGKSFIGSYVLGMGFTFDDTDQNGVANPIALMHELIRKNPAERRPHLSVHRRRRGERQSDARAPSVRHQLRPDVRGGVPAELARPDGDRRGEGEARAAQEQPRRLPTTLVAIRRETRRALPGDSRAGAGACDQPSGRAARVHVLAQRHRLCPPLSGVSFFVAAIAGRAAEPRS